VKALLPAKKVRLQEPVLLFYRILFGASHHII
jgi:hypothetical protein